MMAAWKERRRQQSHRITLRQRKGYQDGLSVKMREKDGAGGHNTLLWVKKSNCYGWYHVHWFSSNLSLLISRRTPTASSTETEKHSFSDVMAALYLPWAEIENNQSALTRSYLLNKLPSLWTWCDVFYWLCHKKYFNLYSMKMMKMSHEISHEILIFLTQLTSRFFSFSLLHQSENKKLVKCFE